MKITSKFTYLGITLTTSGVSFAQHVEARAAKALAAASMIEAPQKLSLKTALKLFDIKVAPTAAYGVRLIWKHLHRGDLETLDRVKAAFLKRVLGLHSNTKNRIVRAHGNIIIR